MLSRNVLLAWDTYLLDRDEVNELSLHFLAKMKIMVISDVNSKLVALEDKQSKMVYNMGCINEEQKGSARPVTELEKALGLPDGSDQNHDLPVDAFSITPSDGKSVDSQIRGADCDLQEIIVQVSALHKSKTAMSNSNKATEDQVAQILKNHMEILIYIDEKSGELDAKVDEFKYVLDGRYSTAYSWSPPVTVIVYSSAVSIFFERCSC
ncbi:unnamed protein product [Heligmosomoides polygyrus]|uniref:TMV resistance protein N-like n=1 Tax=Heligmosomoides polygyrus TaxID=6339 RepID=A0A3P8ABZ3_HELPZ|nr:unnamed protein product [Heligmosomoides polygyrus]